MARIQLAYPKIPGSKNYPSGRCIAFEKYDGTNLHWVWEFELGWYRFGTRRDRFDLDERDIVDFNAAHPGLEEATTLFQDTFANQRLREKATASLPRRLGKLLGMINNRIMLAQP